MSEAKEYALTEAERRHVAEVRAQMIEFEGETLKLKGAILDKQQELSFMRRHLSLFLGNMATNAGLPMGASLSPDGSLLVAKEN